MSSNSSRFGLKGPEDLGDGLAVNWQIESLVALDNAGGNLGTRNTYAGLSSKHYGSVLLGRYDTPYKLSTRKLDNFSDNIGDKRSLFGTVSGVSASATSLAAMYDNGTLYGSLAYDTHKLDTARTAPRKAHGGWDSATR